LAQPLDHRQHLALHAEAEEARAAQQHDLDVVGLQRQRARQERQQRRRAVLEVDGVQVRVALRGQGWWGDSGRHARRSSQRQRGVRTTHVAQQRGVHGHARCHHQRTAPPA
jgi:hypothetical protein